jgi:uncharacterized protein (DUF885 family)
VSLDESERRARFAQAILDDCAGISAEGDDEDTLAFIAHLAQDEVLWARQYWLTPTATPHSLLNLSLYGSTVFQPFRFDSAADAERYLSLLGDLANVVRSVSDKLRGQAERGIRIPRPALPGARETIIGLRASLSRGLQVSDDRLVALGPAARSRLREAIARSVDVNLDPALDELISVLDDPGYQAAAPDQVGWAHYPGGEEAYRAFVRQQVTVDVVPEDLHELGLVQCAELAERMREVRAALGSPARRLSSMNAWQANRGYSRGHPPRSRRATCPTLPGWSRCCPTGSAPCRAPPYGVARVDPELEACVAYGFYDLPRASQPVGATATTALVSTSVRC